MYAPYGPFVGCMDGALDELNRVLRLCEKHGLKAVLDIHAMKGSQVRFHLLYFTALICIVLCHS
jgi:glucan 1,3-beta-glucosidase